MYLKKPSYKNLILAFQPLFNLRMGCLMNLSEILEGGIRPGADIGQADPEREGAYRRGYHQAIAEVMYTLQAGAEINADSLS
ncbi:Uncharacterised protein [Pseudomonas luteola]|uniref:Uncharacterized protein n=1 Tax=Pseudomonas luteola TaxID=47886 RepID=A0A2X2C5Q5_PSELU|nr:Uncharacterised protein [Pseudomonas luteola]